MDSTSDRRKPPQPRIRWWLILFLAALVVCLGWIGWLCRFDNATAFLPDDPPGQWILYPKPPDPNPRRATYLPAVFERTFVLDSLPSSARLSIRVFRRGGVSINGQHLRALDLTGPGWKGVRTVSIESLLHAGTNRIVVTVSNSFGPPALWLSCEGAGLNLYSDEQWQVSLAGAIWQNAAPANAPPAVRPGNQLFGREMMLVSLRRASLPLVIILVLSTAIVLGSWQLSGGDAGPSCSKGLRSWFERLLAPKYAPAPGRCLAPLAVFILLATAWAALLGNNLSQLTPLAGFDRDGHTQYINYLLEHRTLPLADAGWQMYQPPFYYVISAGLLWSLGLSASSDSGLMVLRVFSGIFGLLQLGLLHLCLRRLFPRSPSCQIVGLLLGAFLPANLCLAHHPTNEGLAALLMSAALYFTIRCVQADRFSLWLCLVTGSSLGLAMLTKFSTLLAVPFVFGALIWRAIQGPHPNSASESSLETGCHTQTGKPNGRCDAVVAQVKTPKYYALLSYSGVAVLGFLAVCGWHYGRVWYHFGTPLVGNWDPQLSFAWWQDPGYRTWDWYKHFGEVFKQPLFSSIAGFSDGLYSSFWGDGLASGSARMDCRPQWNYDLMNAGYLLALPLNVLLVAGAAIALFRLLRAPSADGFLVVGLTGAFFFGVLLMTLRIPSYAQVKAFYALPALLPVCALMATGWDRLVSRARLIRGLGWLFVVAWSTTVYAALWIRPWNAFTHTARGASLIEETRYAEAAEEFSRAVALAPDAPGARPGLAGALDRLGRHEEAQQQIAACLQRNATEPDAWVAAAVNLAKTRRYNEAAQFLRRVIVEAPDSPSAYQQLAICLVQLDQQRQAVQVCREGLRVSPYDPALHQLLARSAASVGDLTNAVAHLRFALNLKPEMSEVRRLLALTLRELGELQQAAAEYERALESNQGDSMLHYEFALCLASQGDAPRAVAQYRQALAQQPDMVEALNNLAWILAANADAGVRHGVEAVQFAERACELTQHREPVLLGTLAAAYAEAGRFAEAVTTAQKAAALADAAGQTEVARRNQELLVLYRSGKPFHELK